MNYLGLVFSWCRELTLLLINEDKEMNGNYWLKFVLVATLKWKELMMHGFGRRYGTRGAGTVGTDN